MVMLDLKDIGVDNAVPVYDWDQDEQQVYIQLDVNMKVNVNELGIDVTNTEINIKYNDESVWDCKFYRKVVKETCKVLTKDNKLVIQINKRIRNEEWPCLQYSSTNQNQDSDEDSGSPDPSFDLDFVKNDFYEREDTITICVFVKQLVEKSVVVNVDLEQLHVKFSTKDTNFLKLYEGTTEGTIFNWKIVLSHPVIRDECTSSVKSTKLEIKLKKATGTKWSSLEKQSVTSSNSDAREKDSWHSLGSTPKKTNRGAAGGAKSIAPMEEVQPKKPTCTVQPMSYSNKEDNKHKTLYKIGFTGLDNMGNTCFMNSVLQVLANTRELREYVTSGPPLQNDLNQDNPLGSSGKLMVAFAVLMKSLWSGTHQSIAPKKLKMLVAAKASQFMGYAQHDAQEFMAFLLDILHEDVNRVKKKPYFENKEATNRPEQDLADEAWKRHKARNDSVIVDLFHGQYKSKLVCPDCKKVSVTYDPFMELVVPLPKKKQLFSVIFMSRNFQKKPVRYTVSLPEDAIVDDLKQAIAEKTEIDPTCLRVFREHGGCFHYRFRGMDTLNKHKTGYFFFVVEVLSEATAGEKVIEISVIQRLLMPPVRSSCSGCKKPSDGQKLKRCLNCYKTAYCGQACQKHHWSIHKSSCTMSAEPVGVPFIISLPESKASYRRLEQMMEGFARYSVAVFQPPVQQISSLTTKCPLENDECQACDEPINSVTGQDEEETSCSDKTTVLEQRTATVTGQVQTEKRSSPLFYIKPVDSQGKSLPKTPRLEDRGHEPLKLQDYEHLAMDWRNNEKMEQYVLVESKDLEYDEDVCGSSNDSVTTLEHCIDLFTRPEKLSKEEAWYCPKCKEHKEATKEMSLWRLPSTLIIQLKRFSFKNALWRDKINKKVIYPIRGLDLRGYVHGVHHSGPPVFDLYGVINHHGGLLGGHYMAIARLPSVNHWDTNDIDWRLFDDSMVRGVDENCVVTQSAYLLFYRQRKPYQSLIQNPLMEVQSTLLTRKENSEESGHTSSDNQADKGYTNTHSRYNSKFALSTETHSRPECELTNTHDNKKASTYNRPSNEQTDKNKEPDNECTDTENIVSTHSRLEWEEPMEEDTKEDGVKEKNTDMELID